jgi:ABC-type transport system involved in multi-copper enzyme maturation permease subunit
MARLPGPGPVFVYEWLTASRRWQAYATRAAFVGCLLAAIGTVWEATAAGAPLAVRAQSEFAANVFRAIVGTQLVLVLLTAPASTAGAICLDRARGALAHALVTDLTDSEIVLGKLAARLLPVLSLIACTLPVAYLCTLLGGIDPDAVVAAYAVTAALAVLGCALALSLSIRARKSHEVLLTSYLFLSAWLLARPIAWYVGPAFGVPFSDTQWLAYLDPFLLAFAPYDGGGPASSYAGPVAGFVAGCLAASAVLTISAIRRVRRAADPDPRPSRPRRMGRPDLARWRWWPGRWFPGPSLDANPVLWREWQRGRPSTWARRAWWSYGVASLAFTALAIVRPDVPPRDDLAYWGNGFQVAVGLLLLSAVASTSLAEERARGSLDVLMTTPLPTRSIVWGKWLGTFRLVPWLVAPPILVAAWESCWTGNWCETAFLAVLLPAYGAFVTSLGLATATWVSRPGRAAALCVGGYLLATVGLFFLILASIVYSSTEERWVAFSPFGGALILTANAGSLGPPHFPGSSRPAGFGAILYDFRRELFAIGAYGAAAAILLAATLATFDRCLGRVPESGLRPGRATSPAAGPTRA